MAGEIINRVAKSSLKTINLEDFYPSEKRTIIDIKPWLFKGFILKEKDFRDALKNYDWATYKNQYIALTCSSNAIIPSWAYMLIATYLNPIAKKIVVGNLQELENAIFQDILTNFDYSVYQNLPVIIKGCANQPIPETAYIQLIKNLQPIAKSIMFGEACSSVPLFKATK